MAKATWNGVTIAEAPRFTPTPKEAAARIRDRVAFWKGVKVED